MARPYTSAMLGMPEWGIRRSDYPHVSDSSYYANYRNLTPLTPAWTGEALSAYIMGAKSLWNHNAFFDYVDRYYQVYKTGSSAYHSIIQDEYSDYPPASDFLISMWDTYRSQYGGTVACDLSHLYLCTDSGACSTAGGYWYNSTCNTSAQSGGTTPAIYNLGGKIPKLSSGKVTKRH